MLSASDLSIGYPSRKRGAGARVLAAGLSASLPPGVTALIGRNGTGKSTLLRTLTGSLRPLAGEVLLQGRPLGSYSRRELSRLMAVVTTESHQAGGLTLRQLVSLGRIPFTGTLGRLSSTDRQEVDEAMEAVGIAHKAEEYVAHLSDGERQKGMIARALVQETPLIVMDEPFSFLDVGARLELLAMIVRLSEEKKKTILMSSHEVSEVLRMVSNIWLLADGGLQAGTPSELAASGALTRLFPPPILFNPNDFTFTTPPQTPPP